MIGRVAAVDYGTRRIGLAVCDPLGITIRGLATLVRIPYPYDDWKEIHTFPWDHVPSDLDISPDGKLLSASMSD